MCFYVNLHDISPTNNLLSLKVISFCVSFPGVSFNSVYTQIWRVLLHLAADPFPEVSDLAMKVLNSIAYKVCCVCVLDLKACLYRTHMLMKESSSVSAF